MKSSSLRAEGEAIQTGLPRSLRSLAMTVFHLMLLVVFSLFAFSHNPGRLFIGNDGPMLLALAREQLMFYGISPDLHGNMLQGIGNISFPINLSFMPGFWLPFMDGEGHFFPAAIYAWFAALMFATVLITGWNYRFPRGVSLAAAWLLTMLMFPYFDKYVRIYAVTASSPLFVWYMFAAAIGDVGIRRMGEGGWKKTAAYGLALLAAIFLMIAGSPAATILLAPLLAISFIVSMIFSTKEVRLRKLVAAIAVLAICAALGWVEYVLGLLLYTSSGFFLSELADSYPAAAEFASILFQGHIADRAFGPWLFLLTAAGAVWAIHRRDEELRIPAIVTLLGQLLHAGLAAGLLKLSGGWNGPPPIYTEMTFFALYTLFSSFYLSKMVCWFTPVFRVAGAPLLVAGMSAVLLSQAPQRERNMLQSYAMPPRNTPITNILGQEIPALPDTPFAGRVATVLPGGLRVQTRYAYQMNIVGHNDHQTSGLWFYNIPTLHEYNQLITPAFYRLVREFLTLPNDKQGRSWTNFSHINERILAMLGVRFLLTMDAHRDGLVHHGTLSLPNVRPLSLLEIPNANTQGVAATRIIQVETGQEVVAAMKRKGFSQSHAIIAGKAVPDSLAPIAEHSIILERGGYHIRAKSAGKALLIVPVEYSRCLSIAPLSGEPPSAVRVNLALTGLVFDREMDILLGTNIGPFNQPRCRLKDYRDFKTIWRDTQ
ncbi:MAG: hypothetical protein SFX19_05140 [Alphaproteobacteria bacterium]|nr:hypothetical protein [Alphaproteobacteria bacterium]